MSKNTLYTIGVILSIMLILLPACQSMPLPESIVETMPTPTHPAFADNEVILATGDWPPYVFETGVDKGPMVEIVIAAFKEAGVTTKIIFYPWKRAEAQVRQGKAFAAFPYTASDERKKDFNFSDPMYIIKGKFFYNKKIHPNGMLFNELGDLRNFRIGGLLGSWYETTFKDAHLQVEYVDSTEKNIQKLALGRIDLVVEEENSSWYLIRQLYPNEADQFATLEKPLERPDFPNTMSLMVSRSYPNSSELLKKFNTGLAAIRANGIFKQILEKYKITIQ